MIQHIHVFHLAGKLKLVQTAPAFLAFAGFLIQVIHDLYLAGELMLV
ncbi:MAG: hypothetical protein R8K49_09785 [Mariprofundaceae bacterium]